MKKDWIIPILAISIIGFVIWLNIHEYTKTVINIQKAIPAKIIAIQHFGEKQGTAIKYEVTKSVNKNEEYHEINDADFNNNFFVTTEYETEKKTFGRNSLGESKTKTNYFNLYIYDISLDKTKLPKKIDVYKEMNQRYSENNLHIVYRGVFKSDEHFYSTFGIFSSDNEELNETILYDISRDKWILDKNWSLNKLAWNGFEGESAILYTSNFSDRWFKGKLKTSNNNIIISSNSNDNILDITLFDKYPELSSFRQLDKNENLGLFFADEIYNKGILNLLVPKDENPYDGLILNKENSIDDQEHEIHSFEDYQKYSRYAHKEN